MLLVRVELFLFNMHGLLIQNLTNYLFFGRSVMTVERVLFISGQTSFSLKTEMLDILVYKIAEVFIFFNYSIWKAVGWKRGQCHYFSHEGSGVQCDIKVPWKIGHQYKLDVSKNKNLVTGTITDLTNGKKTIVGVIEVPKTYDKFRGSLGFVEEYSQGNNQLSSCFVMGMQRSIFKNPIGDGTIKAKHLHLRKLQ